MPMTAGTIGHGMSMNAATTPTPTKIARLTLYPVADVSRMPGLVAEHLEENRIRDE
jgi:hypothetical protein